MHSRTWIPLQHIEQNFTRPWQSWLHADLSYCSTAPFSHQQWFIKILVTSEQVDLTHDREGLVAYLTSLSFLPLVATVHIILFVIFHYLPESLSFLPLPRQLSRWHHRGPSLHWLCHFPTFTFPHPHHHLLTGHYLSRSKSTSLSWINRRHFYNLYHTTRRAYIRSHLRLQ